MNSKKVALILSTCAVMAACTPTIETRGNFIDTERMEKITQGTSTRMDVVNNWGTPTTVDPFDDKKWFYIGEKVELKPFTMYELQERQIVALTFDDQGIISEIKTMDKDAAVDVDITSEKTPTAGKKLNAVQQMITNMGKFNSQQMSTK